MSMHEKRVFSRRRVARECKVILRNSTALDCLVRDLSNGGANIEFEGLPPRLPSEFTLHLLATGANVPVSLVWQRGVRAGVRFD